MLDGKAALGIDPCIHVARCLHSPVRPDRVGLETSGIDT